MRRVKGLSGVVISYNRIDVIETCLNAARICDELIVVDKGSNDGTADIARRIADTVVQAPWSPTVEETRSGAMALASGDWILSLDDDECLNVPALEFIVAEVPNPVAPVYFIPIKHYILGRHDPRAYYWPQYRPSLFKRGALEFSARVHKGWRQTTHEAHYVPADAGPAIVHLSHKDAHIWVEKTNRYTSSPDRSGLATASDVSPARIINLMQNYMSNVSEDGDGYLAAVAALRGVYDVIDAVKRWEASQGIDGDKNFKTVCQELNKQYSSFYNS